MVNSHCSSDFLSTYFGLGQIVNGEQPIYSKKKLTRIYYPNIVQSNKLYVYNFTS